jgi:hypothetical protein
MGRLPEKISENIPFVPGLAPSVQGFPSVQISHVNAPKTARTNIRIQQSERAAASKFGAHARRSTMFVIAQTAPRATRTPSATNRTRTTASDAIGSRGNAHKSSPSPKTKRTPADSIKSGNLSRVVFLFKGRNRALVKINPNPSSALGRRRGCGLIKGAPDNKLNGKPGQTGRSPFFCEREYGRAFRSAAHLRLRYDQFGASLHKISENVPSVPRFSGLLTTQRGRDRKQRNPGQNRSEDRVAHSAARSLHEVGGLPSCTSISVIAEIEPRFADFFLRRLYATWSTFDPTKLWFLLLRTTDV